MVALEKRLNYIFKDPKLLEIALRHRSAGKDSNERLEFLGDAILNFVIAARLFEQYPNLREGKLSRLRSNLVKRDTLAELAKMFDIGDCLQLGIGERKSGGFQRPSILANAMEAIMGAIYLDDGIDSCEEVILRWYAKKLDTLKLEHIKDPKSELQEFLQATKKLLPTYEIVGTEGKTHEQIFHIRCSVEGMDLTTDGMGRSRQKAEQDAARQFLEIVTEEQLEQD